MRYSELEQLLKQNLDPKLRIDLQLTMRKLSEQDMAALNDAIALLRESASMEPIPKQPL
jgi:cytochrome c553